MNALTRLVVEDNRCLSAFEILELMVKIADEMDSTFSVEWLKHWYYPSLDSHLEGYGRFVLEATQRVGIPDFVLPSPFGLHQSQEYSEKFSQEYLDKLLKNMVVIGNYSCELYPVALNVWFPWDGMPGFFHDEDVSGWFQEMGVPQRFSGLCSFVWNYSQVLKGKRGKNATHRELLNLLGESINQGYPVLGLHSRDGDLFSYQDRLFHVERENGLFTLRWAYALFDVRTKTPVAYTLFNPRETKRLLIG